MTAVALETAADRELVRALGAYVLTPPPGNAAIAEALGLPAVSGAVHTDAFVLTLPPFAAIYLGAEGKLGGEGLDRVAGLWRVLRLNPPEEADHLGLLLALHAELGDAAAAAGPAARRLRHARDTLLHEHVLSWAPGYLAAVATLGGGPRAWAELLAPVLDELGARAEAPALLPLALRTAPAPLGADPSFGELLDTLVSPLRSGVVLTRYDLGTLATDAGLGIRRGERRYALRALLEQDRAATLAGLTAYAEHWVALHRARETGRAQDPVPWWTARAGATRDALRALAS